MSAHDAITFQAHLDNLVRSPLVVAELSGNHMGSFERALELIEAAARAGAHAVKLQTYRPEDLTLPFQTETFRVQGGLWDGRYLWDLYEEAQTPWEWTRALAQRANELDLFLFSSPFSPEAVDYLESAINPPAYKIASFEINHVPLLREVAATRKPVVLSTGMAKKDEIAFAVNLLHHHQAGPLTLLHCVSAYPAAPDAFNLRRMDKLRTTFKATPGLSDHTLSDTVAVAATALGARLIEKHLVLDDTPEAVDAGFSLTPAAFRQMREAVETAHRTLGSPALHRGEGETAQARYRRSLFVRKKVAAGEVLEEPHLAVVRPAGGLDPRQWDDVCGKVATRDLHPGQPLRKDDFTSATPASSVAP